MVEKTKYILLSYANQLAIVKFEVLKDLNNIIFNENMNISAIFVKGEVSFTQIVKLNSIDIKQLKAIKDENLAFFYDFNAKDIHELLIRLETEGYVAELEQEPSCIRDLIANVSVNDDAQHKLVSDMSKRILELEEENCDLKRNLLEVKDRMNDFMDAAKKLNDDKKLFKE